MEKRTRWLRNIAISAEFSTISFVSEGFGRPSAKYEGLKTRSLRRRSSALTFTTQDHLDTDDTKGMRSGGPFVFCSQPLQYECLRTPWTPKVKIWHLEQACFLTFSKKLKPKKTQGSKKLKETSAQNSIIIFLWIFVLKIAKKPQHTCWNLNFLPKEGLLTRKKYAAL